MSETFLDRLSRFTPDAAGLDRDALLFAAGRASVRSSRGWKAPAGALLMSQVLTVVFLWPSARPSVEKEVPIAMPVRPPVAVEEIVTLPPPVRPTPDAWVLSRRDYSMAENLPSSTPIDNLVPPEPPLHAFGGASVEIPN